VMIATGGALGGSFVVLIAPQIFRGFFEFQAGLVVCGFLLFAAFLFEDPTGRAEKHLWNAALLISLAFCLPYLLVLLPYADHLAFLGREIYTLPLFLGIFLIVRLVQSQRKAASAPLAKNHFPWQPVVALLLTAMFAVFAYGSVQAESA